MTLYNSKIDPHDSGYDYFECVECGHRESVEGRMGDCPECGSWMRDIAVSRE